MPRASEQIMAGLREILESAEEISATAIFPTLGEAVTFVSDRADDPDWVVHIKKVVGGPKAGSFIGSKDHRDHLD